MRILKYVVLFVFVSQSFAQVSDFKEISFKKADSIALSYKDEKLTNLPELSYKLTSDLTTDVERFRAIFKWVSENIANDYNQYTRNKRKRSKLKNDSLKYNDWNTYFRKFSFEKLLKENETICTGYAYLIQELSKYADIESEIVHGFARTSTTNIEKLTAPNHSWNAVKLDGKWYLCDPTWASGIQDPNTLKFIFKYNDGFFLSHPEVFAINHYPEDSKWFLLDNPPSFEEFLEAPILYGEAYTNYRNPSIPNKLFNTITKNETVVFEFQLQKPVSLDTINFLIDNGNETKTVKPKNANITDNKLTIKHTFRSKGYYDVHFFIGSDIISTFVFKVVKP